MNMTTSPSIDKAQSPTARLPANGSPAPGRRSRGSSTATKHPDLAPLSRPVPATTSPSVAPRGRGFDGARLLLDLPRDIWQELAPLLSGHELTRLAQASRAVESKVRSAVNLKARSLQETIATTHSWSSFDDVLARLERAFEEEAITPGDMHRLLIALAGRIPLLGEDERCLAREDLLAAHSRMPEDLRYPLVDVISGRIYADASRNGGELSEDKANFWNAVDAVDAAVPIHTALTTFPVPESLLAGRRDALHCRAVPHVVTRVLFGASIDDAARAEGVPDDLAHGCVTEDVIFSTGVVASIRRLEGPDAAAVRLGIRSDALKQELQAQWEEHDEPSQPESAKPALEPPPNDLGDWTSDDWFDRREKELGVVASLFVEHHLRGGASIEDMLELLPLRDPMALRLLRHKQAQYRDEPLQAPAQRTPASP